VNGRALLRPDEVLTLRDDYLIAFLRGMHPILARRIKWYQDPDFKPATAIGVRAVVWSGLLAAGIALVVWALIGG
jgi:type IV secretory pathway TraG/TraD family ATPase VirD4